MAIQVRRGNEVDFDPSKMLPGEWAVSLDTKYVRMCFSPGVCLRIATYEAFEADMEQIKALLAEAESIEEAVAKIQTEINDTAVVVEDYAILSKSYAVGGTGKRENEDSDNAKYYYEQTKQISQGINGIVPMGTVTFANLPTSDIVKNAMYNVSDAFVSDERFNDGGGVSYGPGNNVIWTAEGFWDVTASSSVTGVKGANETTYRQGNVNITAENVGLGNVDNTSDADKPISTAQQAEFDAINGKIGDVDFFELGPTLSDAVLAVAEQGKDANNLLGTTDISEIGDGTVTGAIAYLEENGGGQVPEMIKTYADIMANTVEGYTVDALAVKEGFNTIGIRYNPENNKVQLLVNGTWVNWMNGISYEVNFTTYNNWMHTNMAKQSGMFRTTDITSGVSIWGTSVTEESFNISEEVHTLDIAGTFSNYGGSYVSDLNLVLEDGTVVALNTFKSASTYSVESFDNQIDLSEYIGQSVKFRVRVGHRKQSESDTAHLYSYINFTKFKLH